MELPIQAPDSGGVRRISYSIEAKNLSCTFCGRYSKLDDWLCFRKEARREPRFILKDVSCEAKGGELTAVAGPSGAGKTTLLEILAGIFSRNKVSGQVLVNGCPVHAQSFRKVSGYVAQEDALFPLLTVEETLMYSALLRLPGGKKEAIHRVRVLIKELGLEHVACSKIGEGSGSTRGISGGEKRRLSIGIELVHDPAVAFIDEPTSGLDSASALQVITLLKQMATRQGKTIILTIHQPGFRILELLDRLVLLSNGRVIHNGSLKLLEERLIFAGYRIPFGINVLEFAIDVAGSVFLQASETIHNDFFSTDIRGGPNSRTEVLQKHFQNQATLCYKNYTSSCSWIHTWYHIHECWQCSRTGRLTNPIGFFCFQSYFLVIFHNRRPSNFPGMLAINISKLQQSERCHKTASTTSF